MPATKPIVLYSHPSGPNPWKIALLLEELEVPYDTKYLQFPEMKQEAFTDKSLNGKVPAIDDPNTGVNLSEACCYGQKGYFTHFHPEKNMTSVIEHYAKQVKRVMSVIERQLAKVNSAYLLGDKLSYADLAFVTWNSALDFISPEEDLLKHFPKFAEWHHRLMQRPSVEKVMRDRKRAMEKGVSM
ncbi:Glutathione S-transferase [Macrophomina phaseolina MS6]|uniref:Glutathione S-transferase n=1 Tax=Macrophomina phaseolina (strain MS6) TaxID=1126212 RepID=K2RXR9_MACPH|nr:Glutathione S-transferase [Macrophomina phaseolina MS6]